TKISDIYGSTDISERHRHRYEVNIYYKDRLENCGLVFSGMSPDGVLPETIEYPDHPWFIGVQYHRFFRRAEFSRGGTGDVGEIARRLDDRHLHAE
ncbi:hypothetical protein ACC753_36940, partial [Rhizobium ruizarguesonis]